MVATMLDGENKNGTLMNYLTIGWDGTPPIKFRMVRGVLTPPIKYDSRVLVWRMMNPHPWKGHNPTIME